VRPDIPQWAWGRKARVYAQYLSDEFDITVEYETQPMPKYDRFDLVHLFEVKQLDRLRWGEINCPVIAGCTAHVFKTEEHPERTWTRDMMQAWADRCWALHGNSLMLVEELKPFHRQVFYLPNGVDADFFCRESGRSPEVSACHVGKPNPRKGASMIADACRQVRIQLFLNQRVSKMAVSHDDVKAMYQNAWVYVTMSDFDGTPNTGLESAACEVMQISTVIGNMPQFIDPGVNGFLIERSVEALVEKLIWAKDHPDEVLEMGRQARKTILESWTWALQVDHVRTMWRDALKG
jgi:glycosyltransferase involved in cell wall biosynthesis